ncbi:hypothetical protein ACHAXS_013473 [Conticribra weissflogii]
MAIANGDTTISESTFRANNLGNMQVAAATSSTNDSKNQHTRLRLSTADRYIVRLRNGNSTVRSISLAGNDVTNENVDAFATALLKNQSVTYLAMFCLRGGDSVKGSALLAASAMSLPSLRTLSWSNVFEDGVAVKILAQGIRSSKSLNRVLLMDSKLRSSDIVALAAALEGNISVETIGLEGCGVTDDGATALAKMLKKNKSLRTLSLSDNGITDLGAKEFLTAMFDTKDFNSIWRSNHSITSFARNSGGSAQFSFVSPKLQKCITRILDINQTGVDHVDIARSKIALHMEENFQRTWVKDLNKEVMPHVLSWCGCTASFEILRNMPELLASRPSKRSSQVKRTFVSSNVQFAALSQGPIAPSNTLVNTKIDEDESTLHAGAQNVKKESLRTKTFRLLRKKIKRKIFPTQSLTLTRQ